MPKRKKQKPHRIPPNRGAGNKAYSDFVAALENIYSLFNTLGGKQDLFGEKLEKGFAEVHEDIFKLDTRLTSLEAKVAQMSEDVDVIKHEIRLIRHDLTQKVNREEFEILAERVEKLEKELAVR